MIHLDANFLVGAVERKSTTVGILQNWLQAGEDFAMSAVAWSEFLNGPLAAGYAEDAEFLIQGQILPLGRAEAELASRLFNQSGRRRGSQPDCFIAATAVCQGARLATHNFKHFSRFTSLGLHLA